ncbi:hypothetical protein [Roseibium sediminicola]|uniref:Uncharacterized protein n=1 Tax=Roseibium sediminicola TaxID=2933272 RepID=A0ABT0GW45_9HYPH|nr:hypothetical protein [Roseibium sp. CAU 1639]MCK7613674.1 hypothetical protein [Roseibium sp. CAU 1639]
MKNVKHSSRLFFYTGIVLFAQCSSISAEVVDKYVGCKGEFITYHSAQEGELSQSNIVHYRVVGSSEWNYYAFGSKNSFEVSNLRSPQEVEVVYYTNFPLDKNYYLLKVAKYSDELFFGDLMKIDYGENLKKILLVEYGKKLNTPPFTTTDFGADITITTYQSAHKSKQPVGGQLIRDYENLFDKRSGWHLKLQSGALTFEDISTRNNSAFQSKLVSEDKLKQKHLLHAQLQRYSSSGLGCVRTVQKIYSKHNKLFVTILNLILDDEPVTLEFDISR